MKQKNWIRFWSNFDLYLFFCWNACVSQLIYMPEIDSMLMGKVPVLLKILF